MWFFDYIFGRPKRRKAGFEDKSKLSRQDILDLVWGIKSLDSQQKKLVQEELEGELDDGGVTRWEYKELIRQMSLKRRELGLSEIDISNLREIL